MTQNDAIQKYLEEGHRLTPIDALNLFGCFRLSGRIFDLKARGLDIKMDMVENKSTGKRYAEYYLDKSVPVLECTTAEADSCDSDDLF